MSKFKTQYVTGICSLDLLKTTNTNPMEEAFKEWEIKNKAKNKRNEFRNLVKLTSEDLIGL